jgi:poly-gamma-glutamate synthase PgsB/CapB
LREGGQRVLAKTTGSRAVILYPDGREEEVGRRGLPTVLEQKSILRLGESLLIDALVSEMMSIRPETGTVESLQILKPHILVVTNVRLDHLAEMGPTRERIARGFAASIPRRGTLIVAEDEFLPVFKKAAARLETEVIPVSKDSLNDPSLVDRKSLSFDWKENTLLALAVAEFLKLDKNLSLRGIEKAPPDLGNLKMWRMDRDSPPCHLECVSCFAANDPESTRLVLSKLKAMKRIEGKRWIGLLNLRKDRGDRTLQWLEALRDGAFPEFERIYLVGIHARAFKKRFGTSGKISFEVLKGKQPEMLMDQIIHWEQGDRLLIGLGNMGGVGRELVDYWEKAGESDDL